MPSNQNLRTKAISNNEYLIMGAFAVSAALAFGILAVFRATIHRNINNSAIASETNGLSKIVSHPCTNLSRSTELKIQKIR